MRRQLRALATLPKSAVPRAMELPVSAPFHCALMQRRLDEMQAALAETTINAPCVPLIANVTAQAVGDGDTIRDLLVQQVTGSVRWRGSTDLGGR